MIKTHIIDNLTQHTADLSDSTIQKIAGFIRFNIAESNSGEYSAEDIDALLKNRAPEMIREKAENSFLVFLTNERDEIIGCGMAIHKNSRYEAKYLNVRKDYRRQKLGTMICNLREDKLRSIGVTEIYSESLVFNSTLKFHKSRGFTEASDGKTRRYTVLLKKAL